LKTQGIVFAGPEQASLQALDLREPEGDEMLIETQCTVISSGTERGFYRGAPFYPFTPGYSVAGVVLKAGPAAKQFKPGERVFAVAAHAAHVLCNEAGVVPIPDSVSDEDACFSTVGAMAMYATRGAAIVMGEPIAVFGQGLIGLICTQLARLSGALPLIGVDIDAPRLQLSKLCGADLVFDARDPDALKKAAAALPGGGVEAVIELTATSGSVELAIDITRNRGRIFLGSVGRGGMKADVYGPMWRKGIQLIGGYVNAKPHALTQTTMEMDRRWPPTASTGPKHYGAGSWTSEADTVTFLDLLRFGRVNVSQFVTHHFKPSEASAAFARLGGDDTTMLGAIFNWK
jgi:2-desacetyl-2-hydroxyethyl bacteriochlorophyllide A dehydrogenase